MNPGDGAALNNLGNLLRRQGRLDEAPGEPRPGGCRFRSRAVLPPQPRPGAAGPRPIGRRVAGPRPRDRPEAGLRRGSREPGRRAGEQARHEEALASLDHALRLDAGLADAWNQRGIVLEILHRLPDALGELRASDRARSGTAGPVGQPRPRADAPRALRRGPGVSTPGDRAARVRRSPSQAWVSCTKSCPVRGGGSVLRAGLRARSRPRLPAGRAAQRADACVRLAGPRVVGAPRRERRRRGAVRQSVQVPGGLGRSPGCSCAARRSGSPTSIRRRRVRCARAARAATGGSGSRISADFHLHATAILAAGLFEAHDRSEFEITAISFGPDTGGRCASG